MSPSVFSYSQSAEVAAAVGKYVLKLQDDALKKSDTFTVAISGGSLGKVLKKALIDDAAIADKIQWSKWEVFFSDERLVPLNHPDSNYGLFNEMVLQNLKSRDNSPTVYTINETLLTGQDGQVEGSDISEDAKIAEEYESKLPTHKSFDLILLGCGPDGHTCSLFPGHGLLQERTRKVAYIKDSPKPPPRRITITFPVLEAAQSIAFVAEGAGKATILKEIFTDKSSELPSKLVNELSTGVQVSWFVDDSAINGVDIIASKY